MSIVGTMEGLGATTYILDFYAGSTSQNADGSEADDAETFVYSDTVPTNASGIGFFDYKIPAGSVQAGTILRATATDLADNTSEFSNPLAVATDSDGDGIPDTDENVNGGDANHDGTPDSQQPNVVTVPDALNQNSFVTFAAPAGMSFQLMRPEENPSPDNAPIQTQFGLGFFDFTLTGLTPGQHVAIQMTLPVTVGAPTSYWRYGATLRNSSPHWFNWLYDPGTDTGAQINGNTITLHFVDGARGDDDLMANGIIKDAGGPGFAGPFTVTNTADSGDGSLRQAILDANANPGADEITFDIPGTGLPTIDLLSPLPAITDPVIIDGLAEPPSEADDQANDGTTPLVALDGSRAGPRAVGLTLEVGGSTIQGLVIEHFSGDGVLIAADASGDGGDDDDDDSFAGDTVAGSIIEDNDGFGVEIDDDPDDTIGGDVISGNAAGGISIHGGDADGNMVTHDLIGTQADGTSPLGNDGPGVLLGDGASGNEIGLGDPEDANTIAFNAGDGVDGRQGSSNFVRENSIDANGGLGIDLGGAGVTPNDPDDSDGVQNFPVLTYVASYGGRVYLMGTLASVSGSSFTLEFYAGDAADPSGFGEGQTFVGSTVVSTDSTGAGSFDLSFAQAVAPGSFITATATGDGTSEFSAAVQVPTAQTLVFTVNTADDVDDAVPDPAHFSLREAIVAADEHPGQDIIRFDLPDSDRVIEPLSPLPDITDPVIVDGDSQPGYAGLPLVELDGSQAGPGADGLRVTGGGSVIRGLVINQFQGRGTGGDNPGGNAVVLQGLGGNTVEGDFLDTDWTGTGVPPDGQAGLLVDNSPDNMIGGTTAAARDVIVTMALSGSGATGNVVEGDDIDAEVTGTAYLAGTDAFFNEPTGLVIESAAANTIGGVGPGAGNVIGGGLFLAAASDNVVEGNMIGADAAGTARLAGWLGANVSIIDALGAGDDSERNTIGGSAAAARNVITGGVVIDGSGVENVSRATTSAPTSPGRSRWRPTRSA